ncbi:hypothetical protein CLIB1444_06S07448 [[Candida] jaroonii]|uniref:Uncharacterized protein n=1 Tax=[Candida] jaroonii TaxID=467808 RepID=A0ACA9Y9D9_9ASCO|nr:hypothetical protein CLIB1444_06S07448 [[Candida] jaroonii]
MENSQRNNQRPSVIEETGPNMDGPDENQISHEFRPQIDRFPRSVSEGPQVPIPKINQIPIENESGNNDTLVIRSNYVVRSVSEGPQVPILRIFQVAVDARAHGAPVPRISEIIDLLDDDDSVPD